jgi:hypothetical protein
MGSGRYCLVIAQLREKFVYPLRIWHFPLPILHMRIAREAKPSAQGIKASRVAIAKDVLVRQT